MAVMITTLIYDFGVWSLDLALESLYLNINFDIYQLKMDEQSLKDRFMSFALSILKFTTKFPKQTVYFIIEKQIIRCSTGSAAAYRAACRARSHADFIYKLGNVEEELDETLFWLEFTVNVDKVWELEIKPLHNEGNELISIIVKSIGTSKKNSDQNALRKK